MGNTLNYAKETTNTSSTGAYTLQGAVAPFSSFTTRAAADLGGSSPWSAVSYVVTDNSGAWEFGEGILTAGGSDTLTRSIIHASSNGGIEVNWPDTSAKDIYSWPAGDEIGGKIITFTRSITTSTFSVTTATPAEDGTFPLISEGDQIHSFTYAPKRTDTNTILRFSCPYVMGSAAGVNGHWTLWVDTSFAGSFKTAHDAFTVSWSRFHAHTTTGSKTVQIRCGTSSGTTYVNRSSTSATPFGNAGQIIVEAIEVL